MSQAYLYSNFINRVKRLIPNTHDVIYNNIDELFLNIVTHNNVIILGKEVIYTKTKLISFLGKTLNSKFSDTYRGDKSPISIMNFINLYEKWLIEFHIDPINKEQIMLKKNNKSISLSLVDPTEDIKTKLKSILDTIGYILSENYPKDYKFRHIYNLTKVQQTNDNIINNLVITELLKLIKIESLQLFTENEKTYKNKFKEMEEIGIQSQNIMKQYIKDIENNKTQQYLNETKLKDLDKKKDTLNIFIYSHMRSIIIDFEDIYLKITTIIIKSMIEATPVYRNYKKSFENEVIERREKNLSLIYYEEEELKKTIDRYEGINIDNDVGDYTDDSDVDNIVNEVILKSESDNNKKKDENLLGTIYNDVAEIYNKIVETVTPTDIDGNSYIELNKPEEVITLKLDDDEEEKDVKKYFEKFVKHYISNKFIIEKNNENYFSIPTKKQQETYIEKYKIILIFNKLVIMTDDNFNLDNNILNFKQDMENFTKNKISKYDNNETFKILKIFMHITGNGIQKELDSIIDHNNESLNKDDKDEFNEFRDTIIEFKDDPYFEKFFLHGKITTIDDPHWKQLRDKIYDMLNSIFWPDQEMIMADINSLVQPNLISSFKSSSMLNNIMTQNDILLNRTKGWFTSHGRLKNEPIVKIYPKFDFKPITLYVAYLPYLFKDENENENEFVTIDFTKFDKDEKYVFDMIHKHRDVKKFLYTLASYIGMEKKNSANYHKLILRSVDWDISINMVKEYDSVFKKLTTMIEKSYLNEENEEIQIDTKDGKVKITGSSLRRFISYQFSLLSSFKFNDTQSIMKNLLPEKGSFDSQKDQLFAHEIVKLYTNDIIKYETNLKKNKKSIDEEDLLVELESFLSSQ
jgi:hypothetical protein